MLLGIYVRHESSTLVVRSFSPSDLGHGPFAITVACPLGVACRLCESLIDSDKIYAEHKKSLALN